MAQREEEAVVVPFQPVGSPLWVLAVFIVLVLGLLGGAVAAAVAMIPQSRGAASPWVFVGLLGISGAILGVVVLVHLRRTVIARRMRRSGRDLLDRVETGRERASGAELAAAILAVEGCRRKKPVRVRRSRLDLWENRLRTRLPRVVIEDGPAIAALREALTNPPDNATVEDEGARVHHWAYPDGTAWRDIVVSLAVIAAICGGGLLAAYLTGWSTGRGAAAMWVLKLFGGLLIGAGTWVIRSIMGRSGWVLTVERGGLELRRTNRRGEQLAAWPLDLRETIVVVTDAAGRQTFTGQEIGRVAWRVIPPEGMRPFELRDPDPALLPWGPAVVAAVEAARGRPEPAGRGSRRRAPVATLGG